MPIGTVPANRIQGRRVIPYCTILYRAVPCRTNSSILYHVNRNRIKRRIETRFKPYLLSNDKLYHNDIKVVKYGLSRCQNGIYPSCYHMLRAEKAARRRSVTPGPRPNRVRSTQPVSQPLVEPRRPGAVLSRFFGLF